MKLSDQVVLVTGASRGLGAATARAFAASGAKVVINYLKSKDVASRLAEELGGIAIQADVTNREEVQAMFQAVNQQFERPVTTVINNALIDFHFNGDARPKLDRILWAQFEQQLNGAVKASLNTTQAALPGFEKMQFGRVINIGSNLTSNPVVPYHDYTVAKGALLTFTRTMAVELGPNNITCNMVSGGLLKTTDASSSTPQHVFDLVQNITPLRKITTPEEMADAVVFFASPAARAITGQNLIVDGGLVMS